MSVCNIHEFLSECVATAKRARAPPPPPPPPPPSFSFRPTRFYCIIWNEIAIGTWGRCAIPSKSEAVRLFIKKVPDSICGSCISAYGSGQIMHCLKNMHGRLHAGIEWTKFQSQIYNKLEKIIEKKSRERLSNYIAVMIWTDLVIQIQNLSAFRLPRKAFWSWIKEHIHSIYMHVGTLRSASIHWRWQKIFCMCCMICLFSFQFDKFLNDKTDFDS